MSATTATPIRRPAGFQSLSRLFNRLVLPLAGTRWLPLYGVITHRGRRSGKVFNTPVVVRAHADSFIVPMPWGDTTDWYRNIRAAGGCVVRWQGRTYTMTAPEVLPAAAVGAAFRGFELRMMQRLGIKQVLRLRHAA